MSSSLPNNNNICPSGLFESNNNNISSSTNNNNILSTPTDINMNNTSDQNENQSPNSILDSPANKYKSIVELQKEINHYKDKERVYKLLLIEKQKKIDHLKEMKKFYESIQQFHKESPKDLCRIDEINDAKTSGLILALKKLIEEKNSNLLSLEELLFASSDQAVKFFMNQLRMLQNENMRKYEGIQGTNIENFRNENSSEKNKLNALLIKIIECQENINNLTKNLDEINDTNSFLKRK